MKKSVGMVTLWGVLSASILAVLLYGFGTDLIVSIAISVPMGITMAIALYEDQVGKVSGHIRKEVRSSGTRWLGLGIFICFLLLVIARVT